MSLLWIAFAAAVMPPPDIKLTPWMVITKTCRVKKGLYAIASSPVPGKAGPIEEAIEVRGNNIVVDFNGATLEGTPPTTEPDHREGLGLLVNGKNVTIKNLRVRGYKVGVMAKNCPGLKLIDCDASYNWKQHLASTPEKEDESDWMSYHRNEKDQWLEYGAGIYLRGSDGVEVRGCRAEGGQCGLMMTECNHGLVWNSDFSFLSGIGIGMYKCSDNRIMHNKIDWCVRGFSYGVYNRGQDSAGILIYEQSNRNVFAFNSVTHGGDGFFLWAGQTTMDTGEDGCNDNLLYGNDFSHAPTNGIEATFSRNNFVNNLILECWHGIWGGYSFNTQVIGNVIGYNDQGIAWEHGQDNLVQANRFYRNNEDMVIWSNASQDPNWGYAKKRDTRSRDWTIKENVFEQAWTDVFHLSRSQGISINGNFITNVGRVFDVSDKPDAKVDGLTVQGNDAYVASTEPLLAGNSVRSATAFPPRPRAYSLATDAAATPAEYISRFQTIRLADERIDTRKLVWIPWPENFGFSGAFDQERAVREGQLHAGDRFMPGPLKGGQDPFLKRGTLRGWRYILVGEWGPYDFKRPMLWPRNDIKGANDGADAMDGGRQGTYEVLGPPGRWRLVSYNGARGAALGKTNHWWIDLEGTVPGTMNILQQRSPANLDIVLEYTGAATTDYRGMVTKAGKPIRFGYHKFFLPIDWTVKFYKWSKPESAKEHANPDDPALQEVFRSRPIKEMRSDKLDFAGSSFDGVTGNDHFATTAVGSFTVAAGNYTIEMTADDGARLWLDGKPLIQDAWHYQGPTLYSRSVHLAAGKHTITVEHFQIDGYAALKVNIKPKR